MQITRRLEQVLAAVDACPYVESKNISFEERPPDAGYISGSINFMDGSSLHIKEYLIVKSSIMSIVKYGYHYSAGDKALVFRYDDALDPKIRRLSTYPSHKHTPDDVVVSQRPSLEQVMNEITEVVRANMQTGL